MAVENLSIEIKSNAEEQINPLKSLRKEMNQLKGELLQLEVGTEEYNAKALELANATKQLKDINEEARFAAADLGDQLATTNRIATGLASGFSAIQGAVALFGGESEALQKTMVKLQAGIALVQGLQGMEGLMRDLEIAKIQFRGAITAVKGFTAGLSTMKKALISTGIGALVVAIGLLIANWDKITKMFDNTTPQEKAKKALAEVRGEVEKLVAQAAGSKIAKFKELGRIFNDLGDNLNAKKQFVTQYKDELANMGIEMNNVNDAEKIFNDKTGKYVDAVMARAKADAMRVAAAQKYAEYYAKEAELNVAIKKAEADPVTAGEENRSWWQGFDAYFSIRHSGENYWQKSAEQGQEHIAALRAEKEALKDEREAIWTDLNKEADELDRLAQNLLGSMYVKGSGGSGGSGKTDAQKAAEERAKQQAKVLEEFRTSQLTAEEKLYDNLEKKYQEYMELFKGDTENQLKVVEWYTDEYTKLVEKELDARIKADAEIAKSAEESRKKLAEEDKKRYEEAVAASEQRLSAEFAIIEKSEEKQLYLNERQKPEGNGEINSIDNELAKLEGLKSITQEMSNARITAITEEQALFAESSARWIELEQQKIGIREETERTLAQISQQYAEQEKNRQRTVAKSITSTFTSALSAASSIISALQENVDTTTKEGFERNKKLQIANATIQMLMGITTALSGAFTTKSGPWDIALAAIQAATIAATGGIQIANIKKQTFDGGGGSDVTPNVASAILPTEVYGSQLGMQNEIDLQSTQSSQKVYVVESDISDTQNDIKTKVEESTF